MKYISHWQRSALLCARRVYDSRYANPNFFYSREDFVGLFVIQTEQEFAGYFGGTWHGVGVYSVSLVISERKPETMGKATSMMLSNSCVGSLAARDVWGVFLLVLGLGSFASQVQGGEGVIIAEEAEVRAGKIVMGTIGRGAVIEVTQVNGKNRLVQVSSEFFQNASNDYMETQPPTVLGWVRENELIEWPAGATINTAREYYKQALQQQKSGQWEASRANSVMAFRLFQKIAGENNPETIAAGICAIQSLLHADANNSDMERGIALGQTLGARLLNSPRPALRIHGKNVLEAFVHAIGESNWRKSNFLDPLPPTEFHEHRAIVADAGVDLTQADGSKSKLAGGTEVNLLEPFRFVEPDGGIPDIANEEGSLPFFPSEGQVFIRIPESGLIGSVDARLVSRKKHPELESLRGLVDAMIEDIGNRIRWSEEKANLTTHNAGMTLYASREDIRNWLETCSTVVEMRLGTRENIAITQILEQQILQTYSDSEKSELAFDILATSEAVLHPDDPRLADARQLLAKLLFTKDTDRALAELQAAYKSWRRLYLVWPEQNMGFLAPTVTSKLAGVMVDLGDLRLNRGELEKARKLLVAGFRKQMDNPEFLYNFLQSDVGKMVGFARRFEVLGDLHSKEAIHQLANELFLKEKDTAAPDDSPDFFVAMSAVRLYQAELLAKNDLPGPLLPNWMQNFPDEEAVFWAYVAYQAGDRQLARKYVKSITPETWKLILEERGFNEKLSKYPVAMTMLEGVFIFSEDAGETYEKMIFDWIDFNAVVSDVDPIAGLRDILDNMFVEYGDFFSSEERDRISLAANIALARWLQLQDRFDEAGPEIDAMSRAIDANPKLVEAQTWETSALAGQLLLRGGRTEQGLKLLRPAMRELHTFATRGLPYLALREQLSFLDKTFNPALAQAIAAARKSDEPLSEDICQWLINGKAQTVDAVALQSRHLLDEDAQSEAAMKLRAAQWQLASLMAKPRTAENQEKLSQLTQQVEILSRNVISDQMSEPRSWMEFDTLQSLVPTDAAYIDFFRMAPPGETPEYVAMVVRSDSASLISLGKAAPIEKTVSRLSKLLADAPTEIQAQGPAKAESEISPPLAELKKLLFDPLRASIGDAKTLVICPDGPLWLVPWAAIQSPDSGAYLIEKFELQLVTSGRTLAPRPEVELRSTAGLIIADPDYQEASPREEDPQSTDLQQPSRLATDDSLPALPPVGIAAEAELTLRSLGTQGELPKEVVSLPNTRAEAAAVAESIEALTGSKPTILLGPDAKETACRDAVRPFILHVATHGFCLPELTDTKNGKGHPLLNCGLLFAGFNSRDGQEVLAENDAILTALEMLGSDFRGTHLVVLSACESGLGDAPSGEGVLGLRQTFEIAGAQSVVSTLWSVNDAESARLMKAFYDHLPEGSTKGEALRQAQIERIEALRRRYGAAHPYFWAAYTLTGNNMPLIKIEKED